MQAFGSIMLTHDVSVACSPESTVTGLVASADGKTLAWSESNNSLNILINREEFHSISIEGVIQGLFFHDNLVVFGDDNFGVRCVDIQANVEWECEISGGISIIENCENFIAVVDNLGRLSIISHRGELVSSDKQYSSIIKLLRFHNGVILVEESGSVHFFDGQQSVWNRPARGEVGESITAVGMTPCENLIIGREGYALVPGEEEALEIEVWDVQNALLLLRTEVKNRLIISAAETVDTYLGFDDGSIYKLIRTASDSYTLSDLVFETKFPIKTLDFVDDCLIAGSWFYLHGIADSGESWMVEHQGIIQYSTYSKALQEFYFAGDDQNDYTNAEPIGCIRLSNNLVEKDKSELTEWFEFHEKGEILDAEQIYSSDEKLLSLINSEGNESGHLNNEQLDSLMSALEEISPSQHDSAIIEQSADSDLLEQLMVDVEVSQKPVANAGGDAVYQSGEKDDCIIILDGSNSSGDKDKIVSYSWLDETGKEISTLPKFRAKLAIGKYRFELRIIDDEGNSSTDSVQVDVI